MSSSSLPVHQGSSYDGPKRAIMPASGRAIVRRRLRGSPPAARIVGTAATLLLLREVFFRGDLTNERRESSAS